MNCKITYKVSPHNLLEYCSGLGRMLVVFFVVYFSSWGLLGQNVVTISSPEDPGPTQQNPVEITFEFDQTINYFEESHINVDGGNLSNFYVKTPTYGYEANLGRLNQFRIQVTSNPDPGPARNAVIAFDFNSSGRIYSLTLDSGVYAHHSNGTADVKNDIISPDDFNDPRDLALDSQGNIYIADSGNDRIRIYSSAGNHIKDLEGGLNSPFGVVMGPDDRIYVADSGNDRVVIFDQSGAEIGIITGTGAQALDNPIRLAVDEDQNVYVNDIGNTRVQIFDSNGDYTGTISNASGDNIQTPGSILVDENGFIYIADLGNINLEDFLDFENADPLDLLPLITGTDASVKVFRRDDLDSPPEVISNNINIPIDLALKPCGYLAVNNADASIEDEWDYSGWLPSLKFFIKVIFDAKTYNILPDTFTADLTITEQCEAATINIPAGVGVDAECNSTPNQASNNFSLVWDETPPVIDCPAARAEAFDPEVGFEVPDYRSEVVVSDNCTSEAELRQNLVQTPAPGVTIYANQQITFTVEDAAENIDNCNFQLTLTEEEEPFEIDCPPTQEEIFDENCQFEVPNYTTEMAAEFPDAEFSQSPEAGTFLSASTSVSISATNGSQSDSCNFQLNLEDLTPPLIDCPAAKAETFDPEVGFEVPDYRSEAEVSDNCNSEEELRQNLIQTPAAGAIIYESQQISFSVEDAAEISDNCGFQLTLREEEEPFDIECPPTQKEIFDENCQFEVPDYTTEMAAEFPNAEFSQSPEAGTFISASTSVSISATNGSQSDSCNFQLNLEDLTPPVMDCPAPRTETFDPAVGFEVPDYRSEAEVSDNCNSEEELRQNLIQTPAAGAIIYESQQISFSVEDAAEISDNCGFQLTLREEEEPFEIECPPTQEEIFDENCQFEVPDYTTEMAAEFPNAEFSQSPEAGTFISASTSVSISATNGSQRDSCNFQLILEDLTPPVIDCPSPRTKTFDPAVGFEVPDYRSEVGVSDNCTSEEELRENVVQTPAPGEIIYESQQIVFTVGDASENDSNCSFELTLEEEEAAFEFECSDLNDYFNENCEFVVPDYTQELQEQFPQATFSQNPTAGTIVFQSIDIEIFGSRNGQSDSCIFFVLIGDNTKPQIQCPDPQMESFDPEEGFIVPDYRDEVLLSDNCATGDQIKGNLVQTPAAGTVIYSSQSVSFYVNDSAGNDADCSFQLTLEEEVPEPPVASCKDLLVYLDENGEAQITAEELYDGDPAEDGVTLEIDRSSFTCADIGDQNVQLEVMASNGAAVTCTAIVYVRDNSPPRTDCSNMPIIVTYEGEKEYIVPDFSVLFTNSDNCTENLRYSQSPEIGTILSENTTAIFSIEDETGNVRSCSFPITFAEDEEPQPSITCASADDIPPLYLDENCENEAIDFKPYVTVQNPTNSTELTQTVTRVDKMLTVKIELIDNGTVVDECSFSVELLDITVPEIKCPGDQTVNYDFNTGFALPDYMPQATASDNCGVEKIIQTPEPGTILNENTQITLVVTDTSGNIDECSFMVILSEEEVIEISCPSDKIESLGSDCSFTVPDYTAEGSVNMEGASVTQSPPPGTIIKEDTTIFITATLGDKVDTCTFELTLEDTTDPEINCPDEQFENFDPSTGFTLPDYRDLASASDNCEAATVTQNPPEGTVVIEDTQITLLVTDTSGNSTQCQFMVILSEEEIIEISCPGDQVEQTDQNCQFEVPNYTDRVSLNFENAVITQSPEPGEIINQNTIVVLTATLDGKTDTCTFEIVLEDNISPVANCVSGFGIGLGSGGTATLTAEEINFQSTDNCGIVDMTIDKTSFTTADIGENTITLTVTDAAGNTDSCQTTVTVTGDNTDPEDFTCRNEVTLLLDETGNVTLLAEDLYTGDPGDRTFELSRSEFSCDDIGSNTITFSYAGEEDSDGSCPVTVNVQDSSSPVLRTNNLSVVLDNNGQATITPEMIDNGSTDNCGITSLSLDITRFTCKDLGQNEVILTVTDENGNSATATAVVTVTGECEDTPPPPIGDNVDYTIIYPNPTTGPFTFATPKGVQILRVEAFDTRGRFIAAKDYPETITRYEMDLTGVQSAVYILKVITTKGDEIVRVIIK